MAFPIRLRPIPLWTEKWSEAALRARAHQDQRSFERGFRLRAFSDEEATFPSFRACLTPGITVGEIARGPWPKFTGVDLAGKKRPGNCIFTCALDPSTKRRYPIDVRFGAWRSNETCEQLAEINRLYRPQVIMVENNAYQAALIEWAEALKGTNDFWMKLEPTTTTSQTKADPTIGLPALQVEFSHRGWIVPVSEWEGATPDDPGPRGHWARWAYEMSYHPIAATSDGVMATWFARQGIELYGGSFEVPEVGDLAAR